MRGAVGAGPDQAAETRSRPGGSEAAPPAGRGVRAMGNSVVRRRLHIVGVDDAFLADRAEQIRSLGKRVITDLIEIGRLLVECKARCGHGNWLTWLEHEFGWNEKTAERYMSLHRLQGQNRQIVEYDIPVSGLYLLAAPSTPEAAREEVFNRAESGQRLRHADVQGIIDQHGEPAASRGEANTCGKR
jgi:hypothetical protein